MTFALETSSSPIFDSIRSMVDSSCSDGEGAAFQFPLGRMVRDYVFSG